MFQIYPFGCTWSLPSDTHCQHGQDLGSPGGLSTYSLEDASSGSRSSTGSARTINTKLQQLDDDSQHLTTYHVAMMIIAKNDVMTTATTVMMIG